MVTLKNYSFEALRRQIATKENDLSNVRWLLRHEESQSLTEMRTLLENANDHLSKAKNLVEEAFDTSKSEFLGKDVKERMRMEANEHLQAAEDFYEKAKAIEANLEPPSYGFQ